MQFWHARYVYFEMSNSKGICYKRIELPPEVWEKSIKEVFMKILVGSAAVVFLVNFIVASPAYAGLASPCTVSQSQEVFQKTISSIDGQMEATISLVRGLYNCPLETSFQLKANITLSSLLGQALPNGGFIPARLEGLDTNGRLIHVKESGLYATLSSYPFTDDVEVVILTIEGFEPLVIER